MLTIILQRMSSPSSSVPAVSDLSNNTRTAVVVGGDGLIKDISQLLDLINKEQKKPSHPNAAQLSLIFLKLKEFLSEGTNVVKCIIVSQGNTFVLSLIQGIRSIHGYPLYFCGPKYLGEIRNPFYQWKGVGPNVKQLKEATELIVEGSINCSASIKTSIMCCTHTNTSILWRTFKSLGSHIYQWLTCQICWLCIKTRFESSCTWKFTKSGIMCELLFPLLFDLKELKYLSYCISPSWDFQKLCTSCTCVYCCRMLYYIVACRSG